MPDTLRLALPIPDDLRETAIAELADLGFEAFEETDDALVAYAPAPAWDGVARETVGRMLRALGLDGADLDETLVEDQNWNATWEASLKPVVAGPFVVAPTWTEVPPEHADKTILRIDPKMSFGTGYHESTRLALALLADRVPAGGRVLDVGTGTGVLALAALAHGAASALGVDIDPWSAVNAAENAEKNGVADRFEVREGGLDVAGPAPEGGYGLVLANIIRSVLQPMLPDLAARLSPGGTLVLAGLLRTEREAMLASAAGAGLSLASEAEEGEWWACALRKSSEDGVS